MELDPVNFLAIAGMAIATIITRVGGFAFMRFMQVKGRMKAALDAMPVAILTSVIAPTVVATGVPETLAGALTAGAAMLRLPLIAVVMVGIVSVVGLRMVLG